MLLENNKTKIIIVFLVIIISAYLYFQNQGAFDHKIQNGKIEAKIVLPSRTEMRNKTIHVVPETYIFMVKNDTITEKFEVSKTEYEAQKVGDNFISK